jgi:DNA mismatch repair protein MutL
MCPFSEDVIEVLQEHQKAFLSLGLHFEAMPPKTIALYSIPSLLKGTEWSNALAQIASALTTNETLTAEDLLERLFQKCLGNHACKNSIKAHQKLSIEAANKMLRAMETTPHASHCNHGRPTYITLSRSQLDQLFKRNGF